MRLLGRLGLHIKLQIDNIAYVRYARAPILEASPTLIVDDEQKA